jgi:deazaflavin-dependent oxidoreductase (nitroreductase family)
LSNRIAKAFRNLHVFLYHTSGGKIGGSINGSPLLLLTVTGRKSGREYTIPLAYVRHDGDYLITASAAGAERDPVWLTNLEKTPAARIEVDGQLYKVQATTTTGEERDRLYALFKAQGSNFADYEQKTRRTIPVIRLHLTTAT